MGKMWQMHDCVLTVVNALHHYAMHMNANTCQKQNNIAGNSDWASCSRTTLDCIGGLTGLPHLSCFLIYRHTPQFVSVPSYTPDKVVSSSCCLWGTQLHLSESSSYHHWYFIVRLINCIVELVTYTIILKSSSRWNVMKRSFSLSNGQFKPQTERPQLTCL